VRAESLGWSLIEGRQARSPEGHLALALDHHNTPVLEGLAGDLRAGTQAIEAMDGAVALRRARLVHCQSPKDKHFLGLLTNSDYLN
jgi:hypothetical protein